VEDGDDMTREQQQELPQIHPEESFLNCIPKGVHPTYGTVPLPVKLVVLVLSMWTSAVTTWKRLTWLQPLAVLRGWRPPPTIAEVLAFATKVSSNSEEDCTLVSVHQSHSALRLSRIL
jgi:hypothetical protein